MYRIDPTGTPGPVEVLPGNLGDFSAGLTFDGVNLWTADVGTGSGLGSISRFNLVTGQVTTFGLGFNQPVGIVFDGTSLWVTDGPAGTLLRVNPATGGVTETVPVGAGANMPVFDGSNVWVPVANALVVVKASAPASILATLTGNGLGAQTQQAAFDGERILVTSMKGDFGTEGSTLSLWKASNFAPARPPRPAAPSRCWES